MRKLSRISLMFAATALWPMTALADAGFNVTWRYCPPPGHSAGDEQAARAQQRAINDARDQLRRITIAIVHQFESSSDLTAARVEAAEAQSAYRHAAEGVRIAIKNQPENRTLVDEIATLEAKLSSAREAAKNDGKDSTQDTDQLAAELLAKRSDLSARMNKLLSGDRNLTQLQYRVIDANTKLRNLQTDVSDAIRADANWRSARARLDQASAQLISRAE